MLNSDCQGSGCGRQGKAWQRLVERKRIKGGQGDGLAWDLIPTVWCLIFFFFWTFPGGFGAVVLRSLAGYRVQGTRRGGAWNLWTWSNLESTVEVSRMSGSLWFILSTSHLNPSQISWHQLVGLAGAVLRNPILRFQRCMRCPFLMIHLPIKLFQIPALAH